MKTACIPARRSQPWSRRYRRWPDPVGTGHASRCVGQRRNCQSPTVPGICCDRQL